MTTAVIGVGHVGLVTAACLARSRWGHDVLDMDDDEAEIATLRDGESTVPANTGERLQQTVYDSVVEEYGCTVVETDVPTAEVIKQAGSAFMATRISFINQIARIGERIGADVETVAEGMGHDVRIGQHSLRSGIGYGRSCFPKDVDAFKPGTDDVREAAVKQHRLQYEPVEGLQSAIDDTHAMTVATEWDEVLTLEPARIAGLLAHSIVIDDQNVFEPEAMRIAGIHYHAIGRG